jgi:hypothetical protein
MNKRALVVGLLMACALHVWLIWPLTRSSPERVSPAGAMPPVDSIAVREIQEDRPDETKTAEQAKQQTQPDPPRQPEQVVQEQAPPPQAQPAPPMELVQIEPHKPDPLQEVSLAQNSPAEPQPLPPVPAPLHVLAQQAPQIESTPAVPDSGPARLFAPVEAREAVVESAPVSESPMPSSDAWTLPPTPSAVAALREPEPPPLPPPPVPPATGITRPATPQTVAPLPPEQVATVAPASPALRLRSRSMKSWDRDDMLASLPKPDPAFLSATDPRTARAEAQPRAAQPASGAIELASAPRAPTPYTPVTFASQRERARGAEAADRGYLKSLGTPPQDPVARIAWGDSASAVRTMHLGRMALVIVDDDLKVVASVDGSSGVWTRGGLPPQMATYSNRVRVVDHVSAFAAFARFCQPNEHLAVLVPVGLERRIEAAMDQAARSQGLSRTQVAACYGRLEPHQGALEFIIDRVERRHIQ